MTTTVYKTKTYSVPNTTNVPASYLGNTINWRGLQIPPGLYTTSDPYEKFYLDSARGVVCTGQEGPYQTIEPTVQQYNIPTPGINAMIPPGHQIIAPPGRFTTSDSQEQLFLSQYPGVTLLAEWTRAPGNAGEAYNDCEWVDE